MRILGRLLTGGLVGFAIVLLLIGNPHWAPHAIGGAVGLVAMMLEAYAARQDRSSWVFSTVAVVAFGVVLWTVWM